METEEEAVWQQLFSVLVSNHAASILYQPEFSLHGVKEMEVYTVVEVTVSS